MFKIGGESVSFGEIKKKWELQNMEHLRLVGLKIQVELIS